MKLIISHFIALLIGVLGGALGFCWGTKYLKEKRQREATSKLVNNFKKVSVLMPKLISEIKADVKNDESANVREFFVLPTSKHSFSSSKKRFAYFEEQHNDLREKLDILERNGFVRGVISGKTPVYRLSDEFVELLKKDS